MGIVVDFPLHRREKSVNRSQAATGAGTIVILPSIRIERHADAPDVPPSAGKEAAGTRARRKRATR